MASQKEPLSVTHPELAEEADGWDPATLTSGSHARVAWKCDQGHRWDAVLKNRCNGDGCPVCSGHQVLVGYNDLATTNPELAAQADGWDPTTLKAGSGKRVEWKCESGHQWVSAVVNRAKGSGCPVCSGRQVLSGLNDLATTNPELAAQADGWDPRTLKAGSNKTVGWKCVEGHRWKASVNDRNKNGCPICSGHRVLVGYNDLATTNPELAAQADGWDPTTLKAFSNKRVGWRCEKNHVWVAVVASRSNGSGCPICSNKQILVGLNDLATTNPELAAQADGWDPRTFSAGSSKKVGWRCEKDHRWVAAVNDRSSGKGCPVCSGRQVLSGLNDLATTNPELAAQADGWDPTTLKAFSGRKVGWRCESGHEWEAVVGNRSMGMGCPICSNKQILVGYNDLATTNPELAAQADGWDPTTLNAGSNKRVGWRCEKNHVWVAVVASRLGGDGCPVCSGHRVLVGYNDLATTNPELAAQADGWDPTTLNAGSNKKVGWKCVEGHRWKASVGKRKKNGCPICSNKQILAGYNDLATTNPELASQADGWDTSTVSAGSHQKLNWKCVEGHRWKASVKERGRTGCPICSNKEILVGYNDLATTNPELAAQADGWDPRTVTAGSGKKVGWKCEKGHNWDSLVAGRSNGKGCPICSGHQVLVGYNDLATTNPELASQADGWDTTTVTSGSSKIFKWRCEKNHIWASTVANRSTGQGCPTCSKYGFDPNQSGWLYFIDHDALDMVQIGISNYPETRLGQHGKRGWEVIEVRGPMEGHLAQQLETAILHAVERRGAVLGHKAEIEKFDGYSEAWTKDSLTVTSFKQLLGWVYEDDKTIVM
jgi:hypothetical protein